MRGLLAWCALAACGRLRFDPVPGDAAPQASQRLYVALPNAVEMYALDPSGAPVRTQTFATQARQLVAIALDASGHYAVVAGATVASVAIDASGALTVEHDASTATVTMRGISAHPSASRFYGMDSSGCAVHEFALDRVTGSIMDVGSKQLMAACGGEVHVSVDPQGRWIFILGAGANRSVDVGTIDTTGHLLALNRSGNVGAVAVASVSDPSGKYMYFADAGADGLYGFAIDQGTGAVTATALPGTPAFPFQQDQVVVAFDPSGRSLYAFDDAPGAYHYVFDPATGGIMPVPATTGAPNSAGDACFTSVAFTSDGRFVYGVDAFTQAIFAYAIDPGTGVLAPPPGSPFAAGGVAMSIAISW